MRRGARQAPRITSPAKRSHATDAHGSAHQVAALCRKAVERVEHRVAEVVGAAYVEHTRATLLALIELRWRSC